MDKYKELRESAELDSAVKFMADAETIRALLAERDALLEALERLMAWQVKNVDKWHNEAYDHAHRVVEAAKRQEGV